MHASLSEALDVEGKLRTEDPSSKSGASQSSSAGKKHIGGWLKSKAATLEGHVKAMGENTKMIAQDVADAAQKGLKNKKAVVREFDFVFKEKALGLEIDFSKRALVINAKPGQQGERLGVLSGDRLVAIDGKPVPATEDTSSFIEEMKYRMSHAPRPVTLAFSRVCEAEAHGSADLEGAVANAVEKSSDLHSVMGQLSKIPKMPAGFSLNHGAEDAGSMVNMDVQGELATMREMVERYERDLLAAREELRALKDEAKAASDEQIVMVEEAAQLRADLADIQLSRAWDTQEAHRGRDEAEEARAEAAEAQAEAVACVDRLRHLGDELFAIRRAEEVAMQQASSRLNSMEAMEETAAAATEHASRCTEERSQLTQRLEEATRLLQTAEVQSAAVGEHGALESNLAQQCNTELLSCREMYTEEVSQLRSEFANAREEGCELTSEAVRMRTELKRHESNTSISQRSIQELKREVQRMRSQLLRAEEAATHSANPGGASAEELEALRSLACRHEASAASSEQRCVELTHELKLLHAGSSELMAHPEQDGWLDPTPSLLGRPEFPHSCGRAVCADDANVHADKPADGSEPLFGSNALSTTFAVAATSEQLDVAKLQSRLADLEARNEALNRQLNERPIVFQFGPGPPDEEADESSVADDAGLDGDGASAAAVRLSQMGVLSLVCFFAGRVHRRLGRAFALFRRQTLAQSLERSLKHFTKSLLQRPVLLWLFYSHLLVLWLIEFWRQAVSAPSALDPTNRLEAQAGSSALRSRSGSRLL